MSLKKNVNENYFSLEDHIAQEHFKFQNNNEKIQLLEDLHKSLFNRLFKITTDIILMQKLIFETYIK